MIRIGAWMLATSSLCSLVSMSRIGKLPKFSPLHLRHLLYQASQRGIRDRRAFPAGELEVQFPPLSFVFTGVLTAIPAWVMSTGDLKKMDAGEMDPKGRGLTEAGNVLARSAPS